VLADELSEAAILEGLRRGRTIVQLGGPDDPRVELRLGAAEIGDDVEGVETAALDVAVSGGAGTFLQLWRDGAKLEQVAVTGDDFRHRFEDRPGAADHRYRVELTTDLHQRLVVTGHIYVHGVAGSGCGCRAGDGLGGTLAGVPVLLLTLRRRRRLRRLADRQELSNECETALERAPRGADLGAKISVRHASNEDFPADPRFIVVRDPRSSPQ